VRGDIALANDQFDCVSPRAGAWGIVAPIFPDGFRRGLEYAGPHEPGSAGLVWMAVQIRLTTCACRNGIVHDLKAHDTKSASWPRLASPESTKPLPGAIHIPVNFETTI
jgi:hypothetical protein